MQQNKKKLPFAAPPFFLVGGGSNMDNGRNMEELHRDGDHNLSNKYTNQCSQCRNVFLVCEMKARKDKFTPYAHKLERFFSPRKNQQIFSVQFIQPFFYSN